MRHILVTSIATAIAVFGVSHPAVAQHDQWWMTVDSPAATQTVPAGAQQETAPTARPGSGPRIGGFVFLAPGVVVASGLQRAFHLGGGLQVRMAGPFAVAAEAGARGLGEEVVAYSLAFNGTYSFRDVPRGRKRLVPFVTAGAAWLGDGYTWYPTSSVGAGLNYWYGRHNGLSLEVREHLGHDYTFYSILDFRIGLVFGR